MSGREGFDEFDRLVEFACSTDYMRQARDWAVEAAEAFPVPDCSASRMSATFGVALRRALVEAILVEWEVRHGLGTRKRGPSFGVRGFGSVFLHKRLTVQDMGRLDDLAALIRPGLVVEVAP